MHGDVGTKNCPYGYLPVTDKEECIALADRFGKPYNTASCGGTDPRGCFDNGYYIYYGTCASDTSRYYHAAICKGKYLTFNTLITDNII